MWKNRNSTPQKSNKETLKENLFNISERMHQESPQRYERNRSANNYSRESLEKFRSNLIHNIENNNPRLLERKLIMNQLKNTIPRPRKVKKKLTLSKESVRGSSGKKNKLILGLPLSKQRVSPFEESYSNLSV